MGGSRQPSEKPIFVISDLHIGDGSKKDNLIKHHKADLLERFLDYIQQENGRLIICGDLFELWRYRLEDVVERWEKLLDRLAKMDMVYITGNHDPLLEPSYAASLSWHPVLSRLSKPFCQKIGQRTFCFMHGHEVDPLIHPKVIRWAPLLRYVSGALEFNTDACLITSDALTETLLEVGEQISRLWKKISFNVEKALDETIAAIAPEGLTRFKQPIRTRNMLARFYRQQQQGLYDITVAGHTHSAGRFGQWYFNCGCWTRMPVSLLRIDPDGQTQVYNWTKQGLEKNLTVVQL